MRKISIFLVFIMLSITVFGQDIIIDFAGQGASSEVTTVEVVNLSNCTSIEVTTGSLNLSDYMTGVEEFENLESNFISSYPNPFGNSTNIEFYVSQSDYVTVTVCDIAGKVVANYGKELTVGVHSFEFTANNMGMYFINVSGTNLVASSKVICLSDNSQQAQLVYNEQIAGATSEKSYKSGKDDFSFTEGDMLKIKGISGDYAYATVMVVEPTVSATYTFDFVACQDGDGNNYAVVEIGEQTWMAENIKTTSYVGGGDIPHVEDDGDWSALEDNDEEVSKAYCFYENDENSVYGALYTYAATTNGDNSGTGVQGVCPTGWHVPSDDEWKDLEMELGMSPEEADDIGWRGTNEGGKLKSTCMELWNAQNTGATNESGFSALPGGFRYFYDGAFNGAGNYGYWWSAAQSSGLDAWRHGLRYNGAGVFRNDISKSGGFSVRCLMD